MDIDLWREARMTMEAEVECYVEAKERQRFLATLEAGPARQDPP